MSVREIQGYGKERGKELFLAGGDEEDLIQEGMIGLFKAVTSYQEEKTLRFQRLLICVCKDRSIQRSLHLTEKNIFR